MKNWKSKIGFMVRSFFGIGDFLSSDLFKKIIKGWFRSLEWATIITALFLVGLKCPYPINNFYFFLGSVSGIFLFVYNTNFWWSEIQKEFSVSIEKVNERNSNLFKDLVKPYKKFPNLSATFPLLLIMLLIDLITFFAVFFALSIFI